MSRWEGTLEGLVSVDSKRLTEVLEFLLSRVKAQDQVMEENRTRAVEAEREITVLTTRVKSLEESQAAFDRSIEDVNKMQDRVHAWSERFKSLEEQHYLLKQASHQQSEDLSFRLQSTDSALREKVNHACTALRNAHEGLEVRILDQISTLQRDLEELRKEEKRSLEKAEEVVASRIEEILGGQEETSQETAGLEGQKGRKQTGHGSLLGPVIVRLRILESKLEEMTQSPISPIKETTETELIFLHTAIAQHPVLLELQAQMHQILSQASTFSQQLSILRTGDDPVLASMGPESSLAKAAKFLSLHQRLEIVEREVGKGMQAWEGVKGRVEQLAGIVETGRLWTEREESAAKGKVTLERMERREMQDSEAAQSARFPGSDEGKIDAELRTTSKNTLEEDLDRLKRLLKERTTHSEVEDICVTVVKRYLKSFPSKAGSALLPDSDSKASELETRLNNYWRSMQEMQGQMRVLREAVGESEVRGRGVMQESIGEIREKIQEQSQELTKQIDAVRAAVDRLSSDSSNSDLQEREQYLRSLVFKLKSDLQKLQSDLDSPKPQSLSSSLLPDLNMEDMSEELQVKRVKIVLQQHDQAIRYLANRLAGGFEDTGPGPRLQSESSALGHVEQLRAEMKDIIAKFETNKALSQRDVDRINEMYSVLDTKMSKDDLSSKVDRSELVRIYRLLKRKTDELAQALKRAETSALGSGREEVLMSRKKLDLECASCGQVLVEGMDPQNQSFQPWGRFPARGNLVGPGFSHILASLVSSPEGSISIGKRLDEEDRSVLLSPTHSLPNTRARRRNASRLPLVK